MAISPGQIVSRIRAATIHSLYLSGHQDGQTTLLQTLCMDGDTVLQVYIKSR